MEDLARLVNATEKVDTFDADLEKTATEMFRIMYETKGVGLAANQVGINKRLAVVNPTGEKEGEPDAWWIVDPVLERADQNMVVNRVLAPLDEARRFGLFSALPFERRTFGVDGASLQAKLAVGLTLGIPGREPSRGGRV